MVLLDAFSANMLADFPVSVSFTEISADSARLNLMLAAEEAGEAEIINSAVGHADTAAIFSAILGLPVPCNRVTVTLGRGQDAIVGQYIGPRLAEGATALPEGATVKWLLVELN